jgi:hypothetical protein
LNRFLITDSLFQTATLPRSRGAFSRPGFASSFCPPSLKLRPGK